MKVNMRSGGGKKPMIKAQALLKLTLPGNGDRNKHSSNVMPSEGPVLLVLLPHYRVLRKISRQ